MCETFDGFDNITNTLRRQASWCIQGSQYAQTAFLSQRKRLISYPVSIYKRNEVKTKENGVCEPGSSQMGYFLLHLCSDNTQNGDLPAMIIFPLPFRSAFRNFKDSIMKTASKNHRNHIAFESARAGGGLCWRKQQASDCFLSYQQFLFVNEKFRGNCIISNSDYHKERNASDIPMQ